MKHFLGPYRSVGVVVLLGLGVGMVAGTEQARAQSTDIGQLLQGTSPLLQHSGSQGYLGVWLDDVDGEKAQALKLKEVRGAVITLIDHDAPAGQSGLHVNDVVLQLNGQNVEGAEQLRRMLREIPPGRKVSLEFSRDGNVQTTSVELVNHRAMEHAVRKNLGNNGDGFAQAPGMSVMPGGGDAPLPGMLRMPIWGPTLNVGTMVEPLTGQMAEYLGIPSGLMVKQVAHKSDAATAGFKPFDVILKVGPDAVTTMSDWDRALRSNQGKQVQVTILRDKKQQTLTLLVDSKHQKGALEMEELFPGGDCTIVAELEPHDLRPFAQDSEAAAKLKEQAEELRKNLEADDFKIDQKQLDEMKQQMEDWGKNFKVEDFQLKIDPKQMEEMKQQMEEWQKNFKVDDFKIDQKQLDELKRQMEEFRKNFKLEELETAPN